MECIIIIIILRLQAYEATRGLLWGIIVLALASTGDQSGIGYQV